MDAVLLLWDIDGTLLIRAADAHRDALHAAVERVWRVRDVARHKVDTAGRTDPEIVRLILLKAGVSGGRIDGGMVDFKHHAALEYGRRVPADLADRVAPGVPELLGELAARDGVRLSLVTGNLQAIARAKLAAAGLAAFFPPGQGGFGSDHEDRSELPAIARRRAGSDGRAYPRERTVVIGDTPRDVVCARADGVRCLAVCTGPYGPEELGQADGVARTARELRPLLDALL